MLFIINKTPITFKGDCEMNTKKETIIVGIDGENDSIDLIADLNSCVTPEMIENLEKNVTDIIVDLDEETIEKMKTYKEKEALMDELMNDLDECAAKTEGFNTMEQIIALNTPEMIEDVKACMSVTEKAILGMEKALFGECIEEVEEASKSSDVTIDDIMEIIGKKTDEKFENMLDEVADMNDCISKEARQKINEDIRKNGVVCTDTSIS
jgi:hypothetical protein